MALAMPILTILYQKESKGKEGDRDDYPCNLLVIEGGSYNFVGRNYRYVILNQACLFFLMVLLFPCMVLLSIVDSLHIDLKVSNDLGQAGFVLNPFINF